MKCSPWMFTEYYRPGPKGTLRKPVQFGDEREIIVRDSNRRLVRVERKAGVGQIPRRSQSTLP